MTRPIYMSKKKTIFRVFLKKLVNADIEKVKQALTEQGYYLQLPPPPEDLLKQHLSVMGQKTDDTNK